jgi:periplasmic protein TonB
MFEAFVKAAGNETTSNRGARRVIFAVSVALHAVLLSAAVVQSFWQVDELSPPGIPVTFVQAMAAPPPPPPPPAAQVERSRPKTPRSVARVEPTPIVQPSAEPAPEPAEKPEPAAAEVVEEAGDEAAPEGQVGGVAGGAAGGVLTSVAPSTAPVPPPPPVNIAPSVGAAHRLTNLEDPRYRPTLAPTLNRPGISIWGIFRICVSADGRVSGVTMLKSADPLVDQDWMAKIRSWQYRPYSVDGRPVAFCHPARIVVNSAS